jgi:hypothetical protein
MYFFNSTGVLLPVQEVGLPTVLHSFACTAHSQQPQSCVHGKHHTLQDQGLTGYRG